jgi:hypothetical protein
MQKYSEKEPDIMDEKEYDEIFIHAKDNTVYAHALVWIKAHAENDKITDREKFLEIRKVILSASKHLQEPLF